MSDNRKSPRLFILLAASLLILVYAGSILLNGRRIASTPDLDASVTETVKLQLDAAKRQYRFRGSAANMGKLGMAYHSNAFYPQAEACYAMARERRPENLHWAYLEGYLAVEMGQSGKVIESFKRVLELEPSNGLALYYQGEALRNQGKVQEAEDSFRKILEYHPGTVTGDPDTREDYFPLSVYAGYQLSNIMMEDGRMEEAENMLSEIIKRQRMFGPAYRLLGNLYRMQAKTVLSAQYLLRASDLILYTPPVDPEVDQLALLSRSESYLLKRIDDAINSIYSDWALKLINHGLEYIRDSKYLTSKAIKTYVWLGLNNEALKHTSRHLELSLSDYNEIYDMAMFFFEKGLYAASLDYYREALRLNPNELPLEKHLAIALWRSGQRDEALGQLGRIMARHPNDLEMLAEITSLLIFDLEEKEHSLSYYAILKERLPDHPKTRRISAYMAEMQGKTVEAIAGYSSALGEDPGDLVIIKRLGPLFIGQRDWHRAIGHYRGALAHHPNEPFILERLGTLLIVCPDKSLQNLPEGRMFVERAFVHTESSPLIKISSGRNLALAYAMAGDKQNALATIRSVISIAQGENYPQARIAELEQMEVQFQAIN